MCRDNELQWLAGASRYHGVKVAYLLTPEKASHRSNQPEPGQCHRLAVRQSRWYPRRVEREGLMADEVGRITINPEQCGGRPCIRGMRIRVVDILELLAAGLTRDQILSELPDLESADITAALLYASRRLGHPVIAA